MYTKRRSLFKEKPAFKGRWRLICCLGCDYILERCMSKKHYMQYKTWVAGLRRRKGKSRRLLQKRQNAKKTFTI